VTSEVPHEVRRIVDVSGQPWVNVCQGQVTCIFEGKKGWVGRPVGAAFCSRGRGQ
jgi:hypothetical protein